MRKQQAIEILSATPGGEVARGREWLTREEAVEALAAAGAFTDGADERIAELERSNEQLRTDRVNLVAAAIADERIRRGLAGVEAVAKDWPEWKLRAAAEDFPIDEPARPVAAGTKARAEEILNECMRGATFQRIDGANMYLVALDRAGFFMSEETAAQLDTLLSVIEAPLKYALSAARKADDSHAEGAALAAVNYAETIAESKPSRRVALEEIAENTEAIIAAEARGPEYLAELSPEYALRLATACRKAGLVKP